MKRHADLERLLDKQGRLKAWPSRSALRDLARQHLATQFELRREYAEREVNDLLKALHSFDDHALLRRELCDAGLLQRDPSGSRYWRPTPPSA